MNKEISNIAPLKIELSNEERLEFDSQFATYKKSPTTALILGLFLGGFGVDRFYIGDIGLGIGKLLTLGGIGVWQIIDWFLIMGATRNRNYNAAVQIKTGLLGIRRSTSQ